MKSHFDRFNEYKIENSKYDVKEIRHYTTLKGLLSILKLGYLRPHKSRGDRDFSEFLSEDDMKAISFLDANIDTEIEYILKQNDIKGTMNGLTDHLALHMDKIAAMIAVDLDKYENPEDIKLLGNFKYAADAFIEGWNDAIEYFKERLKDAERIVNLKKAYDEGGQKGYDEYLEGIDDKQFVDWVKWARSPGSWAWEKEIKKDIARYEDASRYNLKPLSDEMKEQLRKCCQEYDVPGVYRIFMKLGIDKKLIRYSWSDTAWMFPQEIRNAFGKMRSILEKRGIYAPVELRSMNKVYLNKDNSTIYVFTGLVEGTGQEELLPEVKQYEGRYNIKYILPGQILNEKMYPVSKKLTYEDACRICSTPERFLSYIRKNKDTYYTAGEFDKVEPALKYITDFIYGNKFVYKDYLDMIQEYFDEILSLGKEGEVDIYRGVRLDDESDFDWDDLGNCWCYDWDSTFEFLKYFTDDKKNPYVITASTDSDNVDWILSICLNLTHINEKELRLYDVDKIDSPFIESADEYMD